MTLENETATAPELREPTNGIERVWYLFIDALAALGTFLIGVLMVIICADILARNLIGSSLPLVSELGALLLVMIVCLQLATTVRANRLARTELFFVAFRESSPRAGALLSALFNLVGALALAGISWASVAILQKDFNSGEFIGVSGIATMPTWPFRALILLGMIVAALQFFVAMAGDLRLAFKPGAPR
ncbi:TRAP transporter small permease subunit [Rhizobium sp. SSA_523]|uniref:TRAP transporter small permease subunit n=1 Tax=Rhizobium sp. SSA_523 TaxID=2952477 RepID=UPI002090645A|nr:TRAP transporter small permease subunit [Rhizobium sp. SSA_523]MCO5731281.1 TRAP transporter small permease subunit [Rhizobium sp. SSA_523]WKC22183.1 TRAP transporter small permease subunit [Rhizobium sp. SSA_523]